MRDASAGPWLAAISLALASCVPHAFGADGQSYPSAPIRIVVPYPPGGGTDILSRSIAPKLNEAWSQPVVVDSRGGANGTIGAAFVAKAPADGHAILIVPIGFAVNPSLYKDLPFDALRDFAPVSQLAANPSVLVVHPSLPPRTVKEFIALLKARPGEINYASSGNGSTPHLATELFKLMTGTRMTHVPYKGGGPATIDVVAGHVPVYIMSPVQAAPHLKSGRLRALGVTSAKRDPAFPSLPTMADAGVPGYSMLNWYGMLVPSGTPRGVITKLHAETARILKLPEIGDRLAAEGATMIGSTPEQFAVFLKEEVAKAARIVKAAGMTATN
ncbi:MAG: tripartite tricarboxylate transporter substrate binding protein [Burkholderiales bacterium]